MDFEGRFWAKVQRGDGCWEWMGGKNAKGYGHVKMNGKVEKAHRAAYMLEMGPIPHGMHCLHRCDNPGCVRPSHLFLGDNHANIADKVAKGRAHRLAGEDHPMVKLTEGQVLAIRAASGSQRRIAAEFNISQSTVHCIKVGRLWGHI